MLTFQARVVAEMLRTATGAAVDSIDVHVHQNGYVVTMPNTDLAQSAARSIRAAFAPDDAPDGRAVASGELVIVTVLADSKPGTRPALNRTITLDSHTGRHLEVTHSRVMPEVALLTWVDDDTLPLSREQARLLVDALAPFAA